MFDVASSDIHERFRKSIKDNRQINVASKEFGLLFSDKYYCIVYLL